MAGRDAEAGGVVLEVADAVAVLAVDGEAGGLETAILRGNQRVAGDPVLRTDFLGGPGLRPGARSAAHRLDDVVAVKDTDHRVDPGRPLEHPGPVPLHQAPRDHDALDLPRLLGRDRVLDDLERLVLGGFEEAAGVDDHGIGAVGLDFPRYDAQAALGEQTQHLLRIDQVLRAAETDEGDCLDGVWCWRTFEAGHRSRVGNRRAARAGARGGP